MGLYFFVNTAASMINRVSTVYCYLFCLLLNVYLFFISSRPLLLIIVCISIISSISLLSKPTVAITVI